MTIFNAMKRIILLTLSCLIALLITITPVNAQKSFEKDTLHTEKGFVEVTFVGHGTLILKYNDHVIHIDPYSALADYSLFPGADLILITHQHGDHLDLKAIEKIRKNTTTIICNALSEPKLPGAFVMANGDTKQWMDITLEAVPAYNIRNERSPGNPYHPAGEGNGYVITIADTRIYIAGDTENIPEMAKLKDIDVAFLPMNLPYTMTPEMVAEAVKMFSPSIIYPYHFGNTDVTSLLPLIDQKRTEVRIRNMK